MTASTILRRDRRRFTPAYHRGEQLPSDHNSWSNLHGSVLYSWFSATYPASTHTAGRRSCLWTVLYCLVFTDSSKRKLITYPKLRRYTSRGQSVQTTRRRGSYTGYRSCSIGTLSPDVAGAGGHQSPFSLRIGYLAADFRTHQKQIALQVRMA